MSMLKTIEQDWIRKEWLSSLTCSTLKSVTFIFVIGHAGVKGNERVDRLAGEASVQDGEVMDGSDILNALREIGNSSDSVQ
jgi:ribonuclease HI